MPEPSGLFSLPGRFAKRAIIEGGHVRALHRAGMIGGTPPKGLLEIGRALRNYGPIGGAPSAGAIRHGTATAVIDERGSVSYLDFERRSNALANAWRARGVAPADGIAILVRNHRGFLDAMYGAGKLGAKIIFLNTDFAGPQMRDVAAREGAKVIVYDEEFADLVSGIDAPKGRFVAWADDESGDVETLEQLIAEGSTDGPPAPGEHAKLIVLTSGTTGTPKGAQRETGGTSALGLIGAVLDRVPWHAGEPTLVPAPLFHGLGLYHANLTLGLGSTLILRRRFDPEQVLDDIQQHRVTGIAVVPVMLQRMLDLGDEAVAARDLSSLRIVLCGGSKLGGALASRAMDALGDVVYNFYGSTEVAYATIATPQDIRAEPETVGKPTRGTIVKIIDERDRELPQGQTGRIFVGNNAAFAGYTGGGTKETVMGLMSTGDVGHFDTAGRMFVDGRDDEMIVSGGENVFPKEVEELMERHPAVVEAAAIGVEDEKFGQRLRLFLVLREGHTLSDDDAREHVKENLARYKVPREVLFLDELPRNPTGKILKRELATLDVPA